MMYVGEHLNARFVAGLHKAVILLGGLFVLAVAVLGIGGFLESSRIRSMKDEISAKAKSIEDAQAAAKNAKQKPTVEKLPNGLAAVSAFQTRLNKLAGTNGCAITQFQASDQMNPFISTFSAAGQAGGAWTQVEVKVNLSGSTQGVVQTLRDLDQTGIPYEFTSLEMSRAQASSSGVATVGAAVSLRVLTLPGGP
ncbi:MAG: hypothetical protein ACHQ50_04850 [Fimbriimonadales bacterium]